MNPTPCFPCGSVIQLTNIPGIDGPVGITGQPGPPGTDGAPGILAGLSNFTQPDDYSTTETSGKFAGFGVTGPSKITPATTSGRILIVITGMLRNGVIAATTSVRIRYGSGTAPAQGATLSVGVGVGNPKTMVASTALGKQGFALVGVVTGLQQGTPYWVDISLTPNAGTAYVYDADVAIVEL